MKAFVLFAPAFHEWPIELIRHIRKQMPDFEFCGLATGGGDAHRRVADNPVTGNARVDNLVELEHAWLRRDVTPEIRNEVHSVYSHADLSRILVSDRHVGWRYVTGAIPPETPLMKGCSSDAAVERYIFNLCKWVFDMHKEQSFDGCWCYAVAGAPAMALALFCRAKQIPFASIPSARIKGLSIVSGCPAASRPGFAGVFEEYLNGARGPDEHTAWASSYIEEFRGRPRQPDYAVRNRKRMTASVGWKQIGRRAMMDIYGAVVARGDAGPVYLRKPSGFARLRHNLTVGLSARRHFRHWRYHAPDDIGTRDFICYPLHVDPEASTMVWAPMFTDQVAVIQALSKAAPIGMKLVVKEHLPMLGRRPPGFYETIASMPNVVLLSPLEDGFRLISEARLVCAITGTATWESLLLGTPALLMGDAPFEILTKGLFKCTDLARLPEMVGEALSSPGPSEDELVAYLAAVHSEGFEFDYWNRVPSDFGELEREAVSELVCGKILDALCAPVAGNATMSKRAASADALGAAAK